MWQLNTKMKRVLFRATRRISYMALATYLSVRSTLDEQRGQYHTISLYFTTVWISLTLKKKKISPAWTCIQGHDNGLTGMRACHWPTRAGTHWVQTLSINIHFTCSSSKTFLKFWPHWSASYFVQLFSIKQASDIYWLPIYQVTFGKSSRECGGGLITEWFSWCNVG